MDVGLIFIHVALEQVCLEVAGIACAAKSAGMLVKHAFGYMDNLQVWLAQYLCTLVTGEMLEVALRRTIACGQRVDHCCPCQ